LNWLIQIEPIEQIKPIKQMKRPQQADTAIFNPFYFDIPQTSALSPQSYLFLMPDTYFFILTRCDATFMSITTNISIEIKSPQQGKRIVGCSFRKYRI
jgi:hypothetical protein